jgi:hypothetical protein
MNEAANVIQQVSLQPVSMALSTERLLPQIPPLLGMILHGSRHLEDLYGQSLQPSSLAEEHRTQDFPIFLHSTDGFHTSWNLTSPQGQRVSHWNCF